MKDALVKEVEHLEQLCIGLEGKRQRLDDEAKDLRRAQLSHQEKLLRQNEILDDVTRSTTITLTENRELVAKVAKFEQWTDSMDEKEATRTFGLLYQDVDDCVKRHFDHLYPNVSVDAQTHEDCINSPNISTKSRPGIFHNIHGEIFECIFNSILAPFVAGSNNPSWDHRLRVIDKEIQRLC